MENKKSLKSLRNDKRAVSPVIGVILMVAITVILAAVIGAFVFGVGPPATAPTMSFQLQDNDGAGTTTLIRITQSGGDPVADADLQYQVLVSGTGAVDIAWAAMPSAGADLIWDPGDSAATAAPTGGAGLYILQIQHVPTGQLLFEGSVRLI